jgi:ferredoxin/flavodoxin---NADP+ reductase
MICGNPSMIKEIRALLGARGMTPVRRETPGQYIVENFW